MRKPRAMRTIEENSMDEFPLSETDALGLQLAQSRLNEAQLAVQLRQHELESVVSAVRTRYEENGRYTVTRIDFAKMVVERSEKVEKADSTT